jgi:hypothetical protein
MQRNYSYPSERCETQFHVTRFAVQEIRRSIKITTRVYRLKFMNNNYTTRTRARVHINYSSGTGKRNNKIFTPARTRTIAREHFCQNCIYNAREVLRMIHRVIDL